MSDAAFIQYGGVAADEPARAARARYLDGQTGLRYAWRFPWE
jgi:hypothetical protein